MVYQSRHQPRIQQQVSGKIFKPATYDFFYDITCEAMARNDFPTTSIAAGSVMLRKISAEFSIEQARAIPPNSSMNGNNRFSGQRLDGRSGQGALYLGTVAGILREHAHYSLQSTPGTVMQTFLTPDMPDRTRAFMRAQVGGAKPLAKEHFFLYRLKNKLRFADLRLQSLHPLFQRMGQSDELRRDFSLVSNLTLMLRAPSDLHDYSAARGIADAVYDRRNTNGLAGVCAPSSRADSDSGLVYDSHGDKTGGLIFAIFGKDRVPITVLEPVGEFGTFQEIAAAVKYK